MLALSTLSCEEHIYILATAVCSHYWTDAGRIGASLPQLWLETWSVKTRHPFLLMRLCRLEACVQDADIDQYRVIESSDFSVDSYSLFIIFPSKSLSVYFIAL